MLHRSPRLAASLMRWYSGLLINRSPGPPVDASAPPGKTENDEPAPRLWPISAHCLAPSWACLARLRRVNDAFYGSKAWRLTRRTKLFADPLCQYVKPDGSLCSDIADSVHHVRPIEEGGARRDPANLLSVCRSHHSAIHAARRGGSVASYGL